MIKSCQQKNLTEMRNLIGKYTPEIMLVTVGLILFLFTMIVNPHTLLWVGLSQLNCDLPKHSKCVAPGLIFDANVATHNMDIYRIRGN